MAAALPPPKPGAVATSLATAALCTSSTTAAASLTLETVECEDPCRGGRVAFGEQRRGVLEREAPVGFGVLLRDLPGVLEREAVGVLARDAPLVGALTGIMPLADMASAAPFGADRGRRETRTDV